MVRIIDYKKRTTDEGREFFVLEVSGGLEFVKSKTTGEFYATTKTTSIPSTFDEETCKSILGTEMPGRISKVEVEPYPYIVKETGEELILSHRWVYFPDEKQPVQPNAVKVNADLNVFSKNGQLAEAY